ncbi:N-acetylmuramoyl-L-alanine amidase [Paenibacillus roseipurpureus]|uniref:N-acetylmuramoyl-L-alanine amidase n=1 Tax=Paenibacillus roseopurpureus TaxID=2918901 RepID=A0AA96LQ39_9BACL|nr:N-acetylmuramoyl-L-alanine amidase [Paenibacillus sp. MBLB1832]WNR45089.1 N-acetylmuramoyl-L-alanine amidase [Paenibacillus sp. MBLB1832]
MVKRVLLTALLLAVSIGAAACGSKPPSTAELTPPTATATASAQPSPAAAPAAGVAAPTAAAAAPSPTTAAAAVTAPAATQAARPAAAPTPKPGASQRLVMIDPGHQRVGNNEPERVGPDTRETKPKVSSGTAGVRTRKPEYVLNLEVSQLLKAELVQRGIHVVMTRETHDVDISNKQRADMANDAGAALVVRIHADGDSSPGTKGFSVLYPSAAQPAVKPIAAASKQAAALLLAGLQQATGQQGRGLSARDDLSGFNWSKVPVTLVEIGFMTNPEEDELMSQTAYQKKLAAGLADGIEGYLKAVGR